MVFWILLAGLLFLLTGALGWVLGWASPFIAVALVCVALGLLAALLLLRRRARRAAEALERAIARQGEAQANQVPAERRAEIVEVQKQVAAGITALKRSKLKRGVSGASALYALPWYLIIGPPGAGKTTALKHSGLEFPHGTATSGGVRGVGGTRNCDWWFTNEAILLDTAGTTCSSTP